MAILDLALKSLIKKITPSARSRIQSAQRRTTMNCKETFYLAVEWKERKTESVVMTTSHIHPLTCLLSSQKSFDIFHEKMYKWKTSAKFQENIDFRAMIN